MNKLENRMQHDTRKIIDQYIKDGWVIASRDPIVLTRGRHSVFIKSNGIITYSWDFKK